MNWITSMIIGAAIVLVAIFGFQIVTDDNDNTQPQSPTTPTTLITTVETKPPLGP